jgi:uncharacterized protein DUF1706
MHEPSTCVDLLDRERERWVDLKKLIDAVPVLRADEPNVNPEGWSAKDVVWHLTCWNDFVRAQLEMIRAGTFDADFDWNTEQNNARFLATGHPVAFLDAVSALETSREAVVLAMKTLQQVSPQALELFSEAAYRHIDDHVPELRRFLEATPPK